MYYKSLSKKLFECVVNQKIIYESSLFIKKRVIKNAFLEDTTLKVYISMLIFNYFCILNTMYYF